MTNKAAIRTALAAGVGKPIREAATDLLDCLGYRSDRTWRGQTIAELPEAFAIRHRTAQSARDFRDEALSVHLLFQLTDEGIRAQAQTSLLAHAEQFDTGATKSFLFVAVELRGRAYSKTRYSQFAREVNQGLPMPVFVLFRSADTGRLTLVFVDRRPHKREDGRPVLGKASLIRDLDPAAPHRAHLDILETLSLGSRLESRWRPRNFDDLHAAVLAALDTTTLNKRFYKELFAWFERALEEATFPSDSNRSIAPESHVIRLITRLIFIWFIKEKGLVAKELFVEEKVESLLKGYVRGAGDSWYRAVLQNLFFATLNTEIPRRDFSRASPRTHRVHGLYRYRDLMADPDRLVEHLQKTPFINGGLFECLDSPDRSQSTGGWRIDCFTDNEAHRAKLSVPNRLFFDEKGIIPLFERYRFTVEENTPIEEEVALDPELLGSVFENLLAAVNPETEETARKQSGSFYTPREVVDYMVGESMALALADNATLPGEDTDWWRARVGYLLDPADLCDDAKVFFEPEDRKRLVEAVANLTVLDPAVGSGAFLISVLHALTLVLRRIDPTNERWEAVQRLRAAKRASETFLGGSSDETRQHELAAIDDAFQTYRGSDYGRKLFLIQNCLHGVDIQPTACLIAKLRFFISLAIEQETNSDPASNYGVRPLPNLETRILAADALIGVPQQASLKSPKQTSLENSLRANRERHFHATTARVKDDCRRRDEDLRKNLGSELLSVGLSRPDAGRIASWDPYDQNAAAEWFDAHYMFGETGFDIVIGNPPYRQLQANSGLLGNRYQSAHFKTFVRTGDLYQLFIEKGLRLMGGKQSVLAYVTSNSWQKARYGLKTRKLLDRHSPLRFINLGPGVFENAVVETCVIVVRRGQGAEECRTANLRDGAAFPPAKTDWAKLRQIKDGPWCVLSKAEWSLMEKIEAAGRPLREWPGISINYGIKTGLNRAFIVDNETKEGLIREDPRSAELLKPLVRGRDVKAWRVDWNGLWLIATFPATQVDIDRYPAIRRWLRSFGPRLHQTGETLAPGIKARKKTPHAWYELQDSCAYHEDFAKPKLMWPEITELPRFAFCEREVFCNNKVYLLTGGASVEELLYLCDVLNSRVLRWYTRHVMVTTGAGTPSWFKYSRWSRYRCLHAARSPPPWLRTGSLLGDRQ